SLLSYLTYTSTIYKQRRLIWYCISLVLYIFALISKPIAVTLPVILLLIDIYPLKRTNLYLSKNLTVLLEKIPFFILSIASGIITIMAQHSSGALLSLQETNLITRMLNALVTLVFYMEKLIWPSELVPFYPFTGEVFNYRSVVSGIIVLALSGVSLEMARRGKPLWLIAWLYYIITLLPTLSIIQIGSHAAADRFTYLPRLSIFLLVGVGLSWLWVKAGLLKFKNMIRGLLLLSVFAVMLLFSYITIQQIRIWQNSETLWRYVTNVFPKTSLLAHMNLGSVYIEKGKLDEGIAEFKQVIAINPKHVKAYNNLGVAYGRKDRLDEAISEYEKALAIDPNFADAHINLGGAYGEKGLLDEAIAEFKQSLICDPNNAKAYYNLGAAYDKKGLLDDAVFGYKRAVAMNPYYAEAYHKLGLAFKAQGKLNDAIGSYREVIRLEPDNHEVYNELAWIYATSPQEAIRNGDEAVILATRACELTGFKKSESLDTLAAAYAEQGKFDKAVEYQLRAIELAPPQIGKDLQKRLQLYKLRRAYCAP
ncbi:MAG: tetratricopeptide repeat protein, partial [Deltaproteobacteria bacterium]|nr:tetratricopeptide repeat protein [Deltaproteobacteria bacterium]